MTAETPPLSRLFREGFRHWCSHQRDFWLFAAFAIPGIAFFRITTPERSPSRSCSRLLSIGG